MYHVCITQAIGAKQSELNSFPPVSELNTVNDWQFTDNIRT